jgi:tryptophanyl-tRNA synthetase
MLDPPDTIRKKLRSAVTDSGSEVRRGEDKPGVTNLIDIMSVATGEEAGAIESRYDSGGHGQFKSDVADAVVALLEPIQTRYSDLRGDPAELQRLLDAGAARARESRRRRSGDVRPHGLRSRSRAGLRPRPSELPPVAGSRPSSESDP